jgi:hypothetical protein
VAFAKFRHVFLPDVYNSKEPNAETAKRVIKLFSRMCAAMLKHP